LTGCLDEKPGPVYLLRAEGSLKPLADLKPDAFPVEGFAKYMGNKVKVKGRFESGDPPVLYVRSIERLSEDCTPPQQ
jgi:hypothetical protein